MDMGGHRFFSKVQEVNDWWGKMLPIGQEMLIRDRLSRIFFKNKFFDYPITLKPATIKNLGLITTISAGFSYIKSAIFKRPERSLEDFYINRFGKKLYSMFFENYTENLWGRHPSEISPEWGAQRVKGLSISAIFKDVFGKIFHKKSRKIETSLIEKFLYPKLGPGQLWEITANEIKKLGGEIITEAKVIKLNKSGNVITGIEYEKNSEVFTENGDIVISSMPVKDLLAAMNDVPKRISEISQGLPYRDYMTVGILVKSLALKDILKDNWIYVHDKNVKMGRIQIFNNWSPYLVKDLENTIWIGLEYFCNEGDSLWSLSDDDFAELGINEMLKIGFINSDEEVIDFHVERVKKAYPAYFDTYKNFNELREYLDTIENLYCIGRNGQHRYNNIDHSMCTAFETVKNILSGRKDKSNIWSVNTEQEYHEK